jgi:purine-binding chemotaxis protein CheW
MANLSDIDGYNEPDGFEEEDDDFYDEDLQRDMYLTFHLADEDYGLAIRNVIEIIGVQSMTPVPDMPPFVMGVINLRGAVIPIIDIRLRFGLAPRPYDDRTCIIVVRASGAHVGIVVDQVREVALIPEEAIEPAPRIKKGAGARFIEGLGKVDDEVKILLDINRLLYNDEHLQKANTSADAEV